MLLISKTSERTSAVMKKKTALYILLGVIIALVTCFVYIHRQVIRAAIKGEPLPECPHPHPCCCAKKPEDDFDKTVAENEEQAE